MLRRLDQRSSRPNGHGCVWPLNTLDGPGFAVRETACCASAKNPTEPNRWAGLCLTLEGSYQVELGRTRLTCGPASLIVLPPRQAYGGRVSCEGSHCLTMAIDPEMLSASDTSSISTIERSASCDPVWTMVAMAVSVMTIFFNSLWGRPSLFFQAILSVGKPAEQNL